jgi:signal transduction histidine kinase
MRKAKGSDNEFVYLASHQLRTPVTGIKWAAETLLRTENFTGRKKYYLDLIYASSISLGDLIGTLLNVSRIERGQLVFSRRQINIVLFVDTLLKEYLPFAKKKNLVLRFEKPAAAIAIQTDSGALHNIVQSLVYNAIEYTPKGGSIDVSLKKKRTSVQLTVRDTGIGIPKKDQARIFDKYTRGNNALAVKKEGLGLGLYTAAQMVRLLNGTISVRSKEGKGTTFIVELPL